MGMTAAERMELRDLATNMRLDQLRLDQPAAPEPSPTLAEREPIGATLPSPGDHSSPPPSPPNQPASPRFSHFEVASVRQELSINKHLVLHVLLIVGVALLSFAIGVTLVSYPLAPVPSEPLLELPSPPHRLLLRHDYDGSEPPIHTSGGYSKRASCFILAGCLLVSLALTTELRSLAWALVNSPFDLVKIGLLWLCTPLFAVSATFFHVFEALSPRRIRFSEMVTSVNRLRPLLVIITLLLVGFSSVCFSAGRLYSSLSTIPPDRLANAELTDGEPQFSLHHHSLVSSTKPRRSHSGPLIKAVVDSGATAGSTDDISRLTNLRQCDEVFGDAGGRVASCERVGTLTVGARDIHGDLVRVQFTNVRYVPDFKYTLLSVTQLWREQRFEARFADSSCLELHDQLGRDGRPVRLPFEKGEKLPTLLLLNLTDPMVQAKAADSLALATSFPQSGLGFHSPRSTSHVGRLSAAQAGELMHRRYHCSVDKIRAISTTTADGTPNIASAPKWTCEYCAEAYAKKAPHSKHLAPAPAQPGKLHVDIKGPLSRSIGGFLYAALFIDEFSRMVFFEPIKTKADIANATKRVIARFEATVGVPVDDQGVPSERPRVYEIRSDHEGGLLSGSFEEFRLEQGIHSTLSPPHDHDLNPIAEATIRSIDRLSAVLRAQSKAPVGLWPYIVRHAVDVHNSTVRPCGSSPADNLLSPLQRFTLRPPKALDLASFGCRAVVAKPPPSIRKGDLSSRGWVGCFLGRSSQSVGAYDVWVPELQKVVTSSSVLVDEEHFPWRGSDAKKPLSPSSKAPESAPPAALPSVPLNSPPLVPSTSSPSSVVSQAGASLSFLSLFSGAYVRVDGLAEQLAARGWSNVVEFDHDPVSGGGWRNDLLNDEAYIELL